MKRLNNKGFTLIELLAVIVILAIIMVVTIPTVLNSMGSARQNTLQTSANTVADWIEKEYALAMVGGSDTALGGADKTFTDFCVATNDYCAKAAVTKGTAPADGKAPTAAALTDATTLSMLRAAGVEAGNYAYVSVKITSGRACVQLGAAKSPGKFGTVGDALVKSTGC